MPVGGKAPAQRYLVTRAVDNLFIARPELKAVCGVIFDSSA